MIPNSWPALTRIYHNLGGNMWILTRDLLVFFIVWRGKKKVRDIVMLHYLGVLQQKLINDQWDPVTQ